MPSMSKIGVTAESRNPEESILLDLFLIIIIIIIVNNLIIGYLSVSCNKNLVFNSLVPRTLTELHRNDP